MSKHEHRQWRADSDDAHHGFKPCRCGSGLQRYELTDAGGHFQSFVCDKCEPEVSHQYGLESTIHDFNQGAGQFERGQ